MSMRLQRALARAGVASRREAETLIRAGRVKVNGILADLGMTVDPERDVISVGRRRVRPSPIVWLALHKPLGYVVTKHDSRGRPTVFELLPKLPGLTYVGRLDVMTSGLLLLTTDGEAVHRLTHPRYAIERSYVVRVSGRSADQTRQALSVPINVDEQPVRLVSSTVEEGRGGTLELTLVLSEGRNRIVRRLCRQVGLRVHRLVRLRHGPVHLGRLPIGKWRYLSEHEKAAVDTLCDA